MSDEPNRFRVGERVTIYPRGKKRVWCADFWQDGVHRRVSLRTGNKKVATERATKLAAELAQGIYRSAPPAVTVRQAAADYIEYLMTEDRTRKAIVKYRGVCRSGRALGCSRPVRVGSVRPGITRSIPRE
jgi:hypothetical protein